MEDAYIQSGTLRHWVNVRVTVTLWEEAVQQSSVVS
jgi:hypothetical protein